MLSQHAPSLFAFLAATSSGLPLIALYSLGPLWQLGSNSAVFRSPSAESVIRLLSLKVYPECTSAKTLAELRPTHSLSPALSLPKVLEARGGSVSPIGQEVRSPAFFCDVWGNVSIHNGLLGAESPLQRGLSLLLVSRIVAPSFIKLIHKASPRHFTS